MEKVTRFEEKRSAGVLRRFRILIGILFILFVIAAWRIGEQIMESGSLDLLEIFWEDAEIMREFWRENVSTFLAELPQGAVVFLALLVILSTGFVVLTRRKRELARRRLRELSKRKTKGVVRKETL